MLCASSLLIDGTSFTCLSGAEHTITYYAGISDTSKPLRRFYPAQT